MKLSDYFETCVEVLRTQVGERHTIETLINEEAWVLQSTKMKRKMVHP